MFYVVCHSERGTEFRSEESIRPFDCAKTMFFGLLRVTHTIKNSHLRHTQFFVQALKKTRVFSFFINIDFCFYFLSIFYQTSVFYETSIFALVRLVRLVRLVGLVLVGGFCQNAAVLGRNHD